MGAMAVVMSVSAAMCSSGGESFTVAAHGRARCVIAAPERLSEAAAELGGWLEKMTGATFEVVCAPPLPERPSIVIGTRAEFGRKARELGLRGVNPEEVALRSEKNRLWVLAASEVGVTPAVYILLRELGCRW